MIELKDVSKAYRLGGKTQQVLSHASLALPDHGLFFIVGQSGSGKSTAINAIGGLLDYEGTILYDGKTVNMEEYRRKNVAYIFQDFLLFDDLSVRENIKIALEIAGIHDEEEISRRVNALLRAVNLAINPSRKAGALSLGQRQRVAIARALALSPKLILADEPTGNLDSKNSKTIMSLLKSLSKDRLVLIVSHNLNLVKLYADAAYSIKDGGFVPLDIESISLDSAYGQDVVEIAKMDQEEMESSSLLIKLYVGKEQKKQSITIIQSEGKLILVADNAQVVKPDEISLLGESGSQGKRIEEEKVNEDLLHFEDLPENKKENSRSRWRRIKQEAFQSEGKGKKKALNRFYRLFEVIAPLAIFIAIDAMALAFQEVDSTLGFQESFSDAVSFIGEPKESDPENFPYQNRAFDFQDIYDWIQADNGISSLYPGYGNRNYGGMTFEVNSYLPVSYGSAGRPYVDPWKYSFDFVSIDDYLDIPSYSSLKKYHLKEGEIVLPLELISEYAECPCFGGKSLLETIIGTKINMWQPVLVETPTTPSAFSLTIVGVEDVPVHSLYVEDEKTKKLIEYHTLPYFVSQSQAEKLWTFGAANAVNGRKAQNMLLPSFEGYSFYEFGETARKEYDEGAVPMWSLRTGYSYVEHPTDEYNDSVLSAAAGNGLPIFLLSEAAYDDLPLNALTSLQQYFGEKVGRFAIKNHANPDEKAIYFVKPSYFQPTAIYESRERFFAAIVANSVTYNHVTSKPAGATADVSFDRSSEFIDVVIPSAFDELTTPFGIDPKMEDGLLIWQEHPEGMMVDLMGDLYDENAAFANKSTQIRIVGTYPSDSIYDPVYIAPLADFYLKGNTGAIVIGIGAESGINPETVAYADSQVIHSSDVEKTKRYFKENLETYGVSAHTKRELYYSTVRSDYVYLYFDYLFPVGAVLLVVLVLVMLNASAKVNANKSGYGVLRCLGKKRWEILWEDSASLFLRSLLFIALPLALLTLVLFLFDLYMLSWWVVPFFFAYAVLILLFAELPLLITLRKPPIEIMHTLQ